MNSMEQGAAARAMRPAVFAHTPSAAATPAQLWAAIRAEADHLAQREPLLRPRLQRQVLAQPSFAAAIAAVLARRLTADDLPAPVLHALIESTIDAAILERAAADLAAIRERDPACPDHLHVLLNLKGFHALQAYRVAHALWLGGRREMAYALANQASLAFAVDIHPAARIGAGVMLDHGTGIVIGETTVIDDNVSILQNVTLGGTGKEHGDRHPKIRSGVLIGAGAKILGNIEIGAMSRVAAGSVVLHAVPAHCTVAGVPARIVRHHRADSCPSQDMDQTLD